MTPRISPDAIIPVQQLHELWSADPFPARTLEKSSGVVKSTVYNWFSSVRSPTVEKLDAVLRVWGYRLVVVRMEPDLIESAKLPVSDAALVKAR